MKPSAGERWALIYNPAAGGFRPAALDNIVRTLYVAGIETRLLATAAPGHATELGRSAQGVGRVAVYGGDGTLSEAANGLLGRDLPLVVLPGGTVNVLAHELGLPRDPALAALAALGGTVRAIHPGRIGPRAFLLMAGFGFDGLAVQLVSPRMKAALGRAAYVWAGWRALRRPHPLLRVTCDGRALAQGHWVVTSRARHYGGRYVIHGEAGLAAERLSVITVPRAGYLPFLVGNLGLGLDRRPGGTVIGQGRAIRLEADAPVHVQVDGDYHGSGRAFEVALAQQSLRLCFPDPNHPKGG
jgi:diacylglycerol kinase family enzyme